MHAVVKTVAGGAVAGALGVLCPPSLVVAAPAVAAGGSQAISSAITERLIAAGVEYRVSEDQ